jgi:hypothetical protein
MSSRKRKNKNISSGKRCDELQAIIERFIAGPENITDEQEINVMAKSLLSNGLLRVNSKK